MAVEAGAIFSIQPCKFSLDRVCFANVNTIVFGWRDQMLVTLIERFTFMSSSIWPGIFIRWAAAFRLILPFFLLALLLLFFSLFFAEGSLLVRSPLVHHGLLSSICHLLQKLVLSLHRPFLVFLRLLLILVRSPQSVLFLFPLRLSNELLSLTLHPFSHFIEIFHAIFDLHFI